MPKKKPILLSQTGATLLEVMVALGILAASYVALLETQSGSIRLSTYGKQISIASFLAQSKIEETEEKLLKDGFPNMDDEEEDDFEDLGYPGFKYTLLIKRVELPLGEAFEHMVTSMFSDDESKDSDSSSRNQGGMLNQFNQIRDRIGGSMGGSGKSMQSGLMNPSMFQGQFEMISSTLEEAIREISITVTWTGAREDETVVITTHLVNVPSAPAGTGVTPGTRPGINPNFTMPGQPVNLPRREPSQ